jgi:hypothetical protein
MVTNNNKNQYMIHIIFSLLIKSQILSSNYTQEVNPIILDTIITSCYILAPINVTITDTGPVPNIYFLIDTTFENKKLKGPDIYRDAFGLLVNNIAFSGTKLDGGFYKFQNNIEREEKFGVSSNDFSATYIRGRFIRCLISSSDIRLITDVNADPYFSKWMDKIGANSTYYIVYYPLEEIK